MKYYLREGEVVTANGKRVEPKHIPQEVLDVIKGQTAEGKKTYGEPKVA